MKYNWDSFRILGLSIISPNPYPGSPDVKNLQDRDFRSQFGVGWEVCEEVWNLLDEFKKI